MCVLYAAIEAAAATEVGSAAATNTVDSDIADAAYKQLALLSIADRVVSSFTPRLSKAPSILRFICSYGLNTFFSKFSSFFGWGVLLCSTSFYCAHGTPQRLNVPI